MALVGVLAVVSALAVGAPASADDVPGRSLEPRVEQAPAVAPAAKTRAAAVEGADVRGGRVLVEVLSRALGRPAVARLVTGVGGAVTGHAGRTLTEALLPPDQVATLRAAPGVDLVRVPLDVSVPLDDGADAVIGAATGASGAEPVSKTGAAAWQAVGLTGAGVRVGIVDGFSGTAWNSAAAAGEVPTSPAGVFCRSGGVACNLWSGGTAHGVAVTEALLDMAPGARVHLATVRTAADLQAAVDWFVANGVRIVSRSMTAPYDGPGDGTGPLADVVSDAASRGITWFNAAGNAAGSGSRPGTYWRWPWRDADTDGFVEFDASGDEVLAFYCSYLNGLRWSDWGLDPTDYDAYVFDTLADDQPEASGTVAQSTGIPAIESLVPSCDGSSDVDYLVVYAYDPGAGTAGDVLEVMANGGGFEHWQNPSSASGPIVDSADPAVLAVGAIDPPLGTTIAPYSSWGPTNDGRTKPDLAAPANFSSHSFPAGFNGTSAATPVVSGAAAVLLQASPGLAPAELAAAVTAAVVDRGATGPDDQYGAGELRLGTPPPGLARLSGADRFATSAAISAATFPPGVDTAYVATGLAFPDALSGAPAAALGGNPVLLVTPTSVPGPIAAELTRLAPKRIVILGGTGAVSADVETALTAYTAGPVTRLAGADRFATSAAISAATFPPGVDTAYVATGLAFPDALSGAPAAALGGNPVVLVSPTSLPGPVATELGRLAPSRVAVLGGSGAVSNAVAAQLRGYLP